MYYVSVSYLALPVGHLGRFWRPMFRGPENVMQKKPACIRNEQACQPLYQEHKSKESKATFAGNELAKPTFQGPEDELYLKHSAASIALSGKRLSRVENALHRKLSVPEIDRNASYSV